MIHGNSAHYKRFCKDISQTEHQIIDDNNKLLEQKKDNFEFTQEMLRGRSRRIF